MNSVNSLLEKTIKKIESGEYAAAEADLKNYLCENPTDAMAHNKLGVVLAQRQNREQAKHCFEEALKYDIKLVQAHNNLGNIAREEGNLIEAVKYYQDAINIDPNYALPHNNLAVVYKQLNYYSDFVREIKIAKRLENRKLNNSKGSFNFMNWLKELWFKPHK